MRIKNLGFTLIELLVVISIISVMSSIVLSSVKSARDKALIARAKADIQQIVKAIILAQGETNRRLIVSAPDTNWAGGVIVLEERILHTHWTPNSATIN